MAERNKSTKSENVQEGEVVGDTKETKRRAAPWPVLTIGIFAAILFVAFIIICWWAIVFAWHAATPSGSRAEDMPGLYGYGGDDRRLDWGDRRELWNAADASGVVTAVNGDTITVSGRGEQVTVKKTQDTVIRGDKEEVAVNDTVLVYGETEDDGSITAARILIRNESMMDEGSRSGHMIRKPDA